MSRLQRHVRGRRGFTLIEMCMSMVITSLVAGAVGAFTLAVSSTWRESENARGLGLRGSQVAARLHDYLQTARLVGASRTGSLTDSTISPAAIMLWAGDANSDALIQGSEVELIAFDPTTSTLKLYRGLASETSTWSYSTVFSQPSVINNFEAGRASTILARDVDSAALNVTSVAGNRPTVALALRFKALDSDDSSVRTSIQYAQATLRAPLANPGN